MLASVQAGGGCTVEGVWWRSRVLGVVKIL